MATSITRKTPKPIKKAPKQGRKMSKEEAREYVFKTYGETMALLAKN